VLNLSLLGVHNEIYDQWVQQTGSRPDLFDMNPKNNPLLLPNVLDAPLTDKGIAQCIEQRAAIARREGGVVLDNVELIISSPLVRCLQTAHYTFEDFLPCNSNASRGDVKWIVHDGIREELGTLLCNKRGPFSVTKELFPMVDYTHLSHHSENDEMWHTYVANNSNEDGMPRRETIEGMSHRGFDFFVNFLMKRPEKEIVVVGHSHFFLAMTKAVLSFDDSNDSFISPVYGQAEVRSMELVLTEQ
jgi:broad specificity phosphatase PhoE